MPTFFQRPENALKRANEFIDVGKKQRALDALYDVIKSKKHRTWQKIHEPIMEKYLQLCVDLKKSHVAKEGLYQYKNICQQVNIKSLEDVVRKYLALAEEKTEVARQESHQAVVDVDDLDVIQTPENLLLSAVSGEDTQDRTDRAILTPWVKFLWESYRQCLDLLRNNSSVEKLYQDIAQQAFKFCLKYGRKTEFRKLCDNLRTHLGHVYKHQHQQRAINLNNPESQAMHLETRLAQLDSAIQMELWQEAFKAVEDIHGLIALSKKPPKPSLMANYYQKLGLVFWKSGNHMFHACAWHRLLILSREQRKNLSQDELQRLASRVLCATLAIPIPRSRDQANSVLAMDEASMEKQRRLATLLGLQGPPTRQQLVKDLVKFNLIQHVHPELQNLYRWLEVEFHPLKLSSRVASSLEFIAKKDELSQYVTALQDITIMRLLKQVSQVYQTIEFARLAALAPFASKFHLERIVVDSARSLDLQVRIDHRTRSLSFGTDLGMSHKEDVPEGPYLQNMPSENIRNQLTNLAQSLHKCCNIISPQNKQAKNEELRARIVQSYRQSAAKEHQRILMRRQIIEERKEELENINVQREREEIEQVEAQRQQQYQAEVERLAREAEERERQRRMDEHKEIQRKAAKEKLEQLKSTPLGAKVFKDMDEDVIAELDADEIVAKQVEQLEKEKKEMQEKLRQQEKKVDYLERAKRLEEIPLLEKQFADNCVQEKEFWEQQEAQRIENLKSERENALKHRDRLVRMTDEKDAFVAKLQEGRLAVYQDKLTDFEKKLAEERKKRLQERKERRKEERKAKYYKEKEEEKQRIHDEEMKKQREEEERAERERQEQEREEYAERLRKLEEMAEKQRQREAEMEEKAAKRREEAVKKDGPREEPRDDKWRRGGDRGGEREGGDDQGDGGEGRAWRPAAGAGVATPARGGGWREREREKEDRWKKREDDGGEDSRDDRDRDPPRRDDLPPREEGAWRRGGDDRGPPRGVDRDEPRGGSGAWRRGGDDRGPPRDREGGDRWRRDGDSRGPPPRDRDDRDRRDAPREDRWRRDDDRAPPREDREDRWRRDGPPRDRDGGDRDGWRRGGDREREDRGGFRDRDSRGPPRDRDDRGGDRGAWGRRDDRGPARDERGGGGGGGAWRRGGDDRPPPSRDDRFGDRGPARDDRGPPSRGEGGAWRKAPERSSPNKGQEERRAPPPREDKPVEDDGWTTVKR